MWQHHNIFKKPTLQLLLSNMAISGEKKEKKNQILPT
jgi:hypothetical protein